MSECVLAGTVIVQLLMLLLYSCEVHDQLGKRRCIINQPFDVSPGDDDDDDGDEGEKERGGDDTHRKLHLHTTTHTPRQTAAFFACFFA